MTENNPPKIPDTAAMHTLASEPLHETANLALWEMDTGLEIHLQGSTHAVLVGKPATIEKGKRFMENAERYPANLRKFVNHPA